MTVAHTTGRCVATRVHDGACRSGVAHLLSLARESALLRGLGHAVGSRARAIVVRGGARATSEGNRDRRRARERPGGAASTSSTRSTTLLLSHGAHTLPDGLLIPRRLQRRRDTSPARYKRSQSSSSHFGRRPDGGDGLSSRSTRRRCGPVRPRTEVAHATLPRGGLAAHAHLGERPTIARARRTLLASDGAGTRAGVQARKQCVCTKTTLSQAWSGNCIRGPQCAFEMSMFMCPAVHKLTRN